MTRLILKHRSDGWWIVDPQQRLDDHGPYSTKKEASEDRSGLERWLRQNPELQI